MPKERFFHPAVVEGHEQEALDEGRAFEVAWGRVSYQDAPSVAVAGIPMDESAVTRLIATLKRARRQVFPRFAAPPTLLPFEGEITPLIRSIARALNIESIDAKVGEGDLHLAARLARHLADSSPEA